MFEKIIESLLGDWGKTALSFVYKYQLIISIAVVVWGIVIIVIRHRKKNAAEENNDKEE